MKKVNLNIDDEGREFLRGLYRAEVKANRGIERETLYERLYRRIVVFVGDNPAIAARAVFDSIDEVETRTSDKIGKDDQGEFDDFVDGTIMAINKLRITKEDMGVEHWRQKRQQIHDNQARTNASADRAIAICDRHIDELLGGKAA